MDVLLPILISKEIVDARSFVSGLDGAYKKFLAVHPE
jgi:hypothetical protein